MCIELLIGDGDDDDDDNDDDDDDDDDDGNNWGSVGLVVVHAFTIFGEV